MPQITLTPTQPIPIHELNITCGTVNLGTIKEIVGNPNYKYHVILKSQHNQNIYQGMGMTADLALRDAIDRSRNLRIRELQELEKLENVIWGDDEPDQ